MHVTYTHTDYLSPHAAAHPRQDSSAIKPTHFRDPNQSYRMIPQPHWHSKRERELAKNLFAQKFIHFPRENKIFPQKLFHIYSSQNSGILKLYKQ